MNQSAEPERDDTGFFQPYAEFSKVLRTWFIAFGAGALALVLSNNAVHGAAAKSGRLRVIAVLLLAGVAVQILFAILYKHSMWQLYAGELAPQRKASRWYKVAEAVSDSHLLDILGDLATLALFAAATIVFFHSYLSGAA
jgi:hypothetical protein